MAKQKTDETNKAVAEVDNPHDLSHLNFVDDDEATDEGPGVPPTKEPDKAPPTTNDTPAPAAKTPNPPAKPKHPRFLVRRALDLGASQADIDAADTEDLDAWVYSETLKRETAKPAAAETSKAAASPEDDEEAVFRHMEAINVDQKVIDYMRKQRAKIKDLEGGVSKRLEEVEKREQERSRTAAINIIDSAFDVLAEYESVIGKGTAGEVSKDNPSAFKRRRLLLAAANIDPLNPPPVSILAKRLKAEIVEHFKPVTKEEANLYAEAAKTPPLPAVNGTNGTARKITEQEWEEAATAVPTDKKAKPIKGDLAAMNAIRAWKKRQGYTSEGGVDELDGVPD